MECPICIEELDLKENDKIFLDCKHWFHKSCILKWWNSIKTMACPYCMSEENCENLAYDSFLLKMGSCNCKRGLPGTLLLKERIIETINESPILLEGPIYRKIYNILQDSKNDVIIKKLLNGLIERLENLTERGYFRKYGEIYYYR